MIDCATSIHPGEHRKQSCPHSSTRQMWTMGLALIAVGEVLKIRALLDAISGDVWLYFHTADGLLHGVLPYAERPFAYPPYALLWLLPPLAAGSHPAVYSVLFSLEMLVLDIALQLAILSASLRLFDGADSANPLRMHGARRDHQSMLTHPAISAVLVYVLASVGLQNVILERFDLAATIVIALAVGMLARGDAWLSGYLAVFAAGIKVFPGLALPVMTLAAWRQGRLGSFLAGALLSALPLGVIGIFLPWWNFAGLHAGRGLQVESLAASVIWVLHRCAGLKAVWVNLGSWFEVIGPLATASRPFVIGAWLAITVSSVCLSLRLVVRAPLLSLPLLVRACTLPVLGFLALAPVLSPQFLIWLLPAFAVTTAQGAWKEGWLFALACGLTALIFPTPQYEAGINVFQSGFLLLRNFVLVYLWARLAAEVMSETRRAKGTEDGHSAAKEFPGLQKLSPSSSVPEAKVRNCWGF